MFVSLSQLTLENKHLKQHSNFEEELNNYMRRSKKEISSLRFELMRVKDENTSLKEEIQAMQSKQSRLNCTQYCSGSLIYLLQQMID